MLLYMPEIKLVRKLHTSPCMLLRFKRTSVIVSSIVVCVSIFQRTEYMQFSFFCEIKNLKCPCCLLQRINHIFGMQMSHKNGGNLMILLSNITFIAVLYNRLLAHAITNNPFWFLSANRKSLPQDYETPATCISHLSTANNIFC